MLAILERAFAKHAGDDARITPAELQAALGLKSEYLARRVFAQFDANHDGAIDKGEFVEGVRALVFGTDREKLRFAFNVHDHDGDGSLSWDEILRMLAIAIAESDVIGRATQPPEHLARALFAAADKNADGRISFEELEAFLQKRPDLLRKMTRSEAIWIAPNEELLLWLEDRTKAKDAPAREGGWGPRVVVLLWVLAHVAIFAVAWRAAPPGQNALVLLGRALGKCAAFDGALILLPVLRRLVTRLRGTRSGASCRSTTRSISTGSSATRSSRWRSVTPRRSSRPTPRDIPPRGGSSRPSAERRAPSSSASSP